MKLPYSDISRLIYASTALANAGVESKIALFHPDHEEALRPIIRGLTALLCINIPEHLLKSVETGKESAEIIPSEARHDNDTVAEALKGQIASLTVSHIKHTAAGCSSSSITDEIKRCADAASSILTSPPAPGRIKPFPPEPNSLRQQLNHKF